MTDAVIRSEGLSRNFGEIKAVQSIDLKVREGSVYAFLGPNGAGKTTTIRMLLGLIKPSSGDIKLFGQDIKKNRIAILKRTGSLVENPSVYAHLTGRENLRLTQKMTRVDDSRIDETLRIVDLLDTANRRVKEFSLGMKQRLGLAQALLSEPELLILDEPTNGLDPAGIQSMRELIKRMPEEFGLTVFLSSHLLGEVEKVATDVGIINKGEIAFQGSLKELDAIRRDSLEIICEPGADAEAVISKLGFEFQQNDKNRFAVKIKEDSEISAINSALVNAGVSVFKLLHCKPSLEETFMSLTEHGGE